MISIGKEEKCPAAEEKQSDFRAQKKKIIKALVVFFSGRNREGKVCKSVCVGHCLLFVATAALVYQFVFIITMAKVSQLWQASNN